MLFIIGKMLLEQDKSTSIHHIADVEERQTIIHLWRELCYQLV